MKKIVLFFVLALAINIAGAQTKNRSAALSSLKKGALDKAKTLIDQAITHPQTINDAKTWFYRGNIYMQIFASTNPAYKALDADPLLTAFNSYVKAQELDKKKEIYADVFTNLYMLSEQMFNAGAEAYKVQDFKLATKMFSNSTLVTKHMGSIDTSTYYYAGMTAELAEDFPRAKKIYADLVGMNYAKADLYTSLSNISLREKDTLKAIEYINKGRGLFPEDFGLLVNETNIFLATRKTDKALKNLEKAVTIDDKNPSIYFAVGTIYDQLKNTNPTKAKEMFGKAEESYKKAIDIKADYFDAIYNLGALYVNEAAAILDKANLLPLSEVKKYDEMKTEADVLLSKSLPYLEKAHELEPNNIGTMNSLKEIYTRLNKLDQLKVINDKIQKYNSGN